LQPGNEIRPKRLGKALMDGLECAQLVFGKPVGKPEIECENFLLRLLSLLVDNGQFSVGGRYSREQTVNLLLREDFWHGLFLLDDEFTEVHVCQLSAGCEFADAVGNLRAEGFALLHAHQLIQPFTGQNRIQRVAYLQLFFF